MMPVPLPAQVPAKEGLAQLPGTRLGYWDTGGDGAPIVLLQPGVLGIRLNIAAEPAGWLTDGTADWYWPAAEKAGIPVMFLTTGQTHLFAAIAGRHPQLALIIDHMGISLSGPRKCRRRSNSRPRSRDIRTSR
jgi:hypothetical protein